METPNHTFPWQVADFVLLTGAGTPKSPIIKMELLHFQRKNVYVNAPPCYVISKMYIFQ